MSPHLQQLLLQVNIKTFVYKPQQHVHVKVTSHLQRPKKSFFFLFGKIEVSHFI